MSQKTNCIDMKLKLFPSIISSGRIKNSRCIVHLNMGDSGKYYWAAHIHLGQNHFQCIPGDTYSKVRNLFRNNSESVNTGLLSSDPATKLRLCCLDKKSSNSSVQVSRAGKTRCKEDTLKSLFSYFYLKDKEGNTCLQYFIYDDTDL